MIGKFHRRRAEAEMCRLGGLPGDGVRDVPVRVPQVSGPPHPGVTTTSGRGPSRHRQHARRRIRTQRRRRGRLVACGVAAALAVVLPVPAAGAATGPLPWLSGVAGQTTGDAQAWAAYRGRPVGVLSTYVDRSDGWDDLVDPGYLWSRLVGFHGQVVVSVPFWPENYNNPVNLAHCADGYYVAQWRRFGQSLVGAGRAGAIVRLAWEANGGWYQWSATNTPEWQQCFRQTVTAIRATDHAVKIEWSINNHYSLLPLATHNPYDLYPGNGYVDIIGMSDYDHWPASPNQAAWNAQFNGPGGLAGLIRFAVAHGKKFSVSEWGLGQTSKGGAGDDPYYIHQMFNVFSFFRRDLAYEAYLSLDDPTNIISTLTTAGVDQRSSALYRTLWDSAT
jgi:Glycosyl hydrolase family 26